jgi:hypothetical protein
VQVIVTPDATNATTVSAKPALPPSDVANEPSRAGNPGGEADWHAPATRQTIPVTRREFTPNDSECGDANFFAPTYDEKNRSPGL